MDDVIAAEAGSTIPEIFGREGEAEFRERERAAIRDMAARRAACAGAWRRRD